MSAASKNLQRFFSQYKIATLLLATAIIWFLFDYLTNGAFISPRNISNLFRQMAIAGMLASGMIFIIILGEIDLSVGSLLGLLGGIGAILDYYYHLPLPAIFGIVILVGVLLGSLTGYFVSYIRVPSFIVSLAGFLAFRGILLGLTKGQTVPVESKELIEFGQGYLPFYLGNAIALLTFLFMGYQTYRSRANRQRYQLYVDPLWKDAAKLSVIGVIVLGFMLTLNSYEGVPLPVLFVLIILGLFTFTANNTVFGRRIYSIGSNLEATRLSGVDVRFIKVLVFVLMGLMCAMAGMTTTARLAAGGPSAGNLGEMDAISACYIGGASSKGGVGTVHGALIGALITTSLDNGMSMLGLDSFWQMIVKGSILLLAVWVDVLSGSGER